MGGGKFQATASAVVFRVSPFMGKTLSLLGEGLHSPVSLFLFANLFPSPRLPAQLLPLCFLSVLGVLGFAWIDDGFVGLGFGGSLVFWVRVSSSGFGGYPDSMSPSAKSLLGFLYSFLFLFIPAAQPIRSCASSRNKARIRKSIVVFGLPWFRDGFGHPRFLVVEFWGFRVLSGFGVCSNFFEGFMVVEVSHRLQCFFLLIQSLLPVLLLLITAHAPIWCGSVSSACDVFVFVFLFFGFGFCFVVFGCSLLLVLLVLAHAVFSGILLTALVLAIGLVTVVVSKLLKATTVSSSVVSRVVIWNPFSVALAFVLVLSFSFLLLVLPVLAFVGLGFRSTLRGPCSLVVYFLLFVWFMLFVRFLLFV